jgi:hypothetical protein
MQVWGQYFIHYLFWNQLFNACAKFVYSLLGGGLDLRDILFLLGKHNTDFVNFFVMYMTSSLYQLWEFSVLLHMFSPVFLYHFFVVSQKPAEEIVNIHDLHHTIAANTLLQRTCNNLMSSKLCNLVHRHMVIQPSDSMNLDYTNVSVSILHWCPVLVLTNKSNINIHY